MAAYELSDNIKKKNTFKSSLGKKIMTTTIEKQKRKITATIEYQRKKRLWRIPNKNNNIFLLFYICQLKFSVDLKHFCHVNVGKLKNIVFSKFRSII